MTSAKNTAWLLVLVLLICPLMQQLKPVIQSAPLQGYFLVVQMPEISEKNWFSGVYQDSCALAINDHIAFKPDFVRLFNQVDYSLFRLPHAEKIIVGKEGCLMARQYIDAYLGNDYAGREFIREKVRKYSHLQELLWKNEGKLLLLIFTPDKSTYYSECIPNRFLARKKRETNYEGYLAEVQESGAAFIDFNRYFLTIKETDPHVLYPKTGIHWSNYGAILAADSLTRFLEQALDIDLPEVVIDSIEETMDLRHPDGDMASTMNLIWEIPHPTMAYPVFHVEPFPDSTRIRVLVIGDSFYWNWYELGYIRNTFANEAFWYYNKEVYPENFTTPTTVWDIDREAAIREADVILLLLVNGGYGDIGYGFLEELEAYMGIEDPRVADIIEQMKTNPEWMTALKGKAIARGITIEDMMKADARYVLDQQQRKTNDQPSQ